jgi:predicted esterase
LAFNRVKKFFSGNRRLVTVAAVLLLVPAGILVFGEWYRGRDYRERFLELHGGLETADVRFAEQMNDGHTVYDVRLGNGDGLVVNGYLKVPDELERRCPALLILGGVRTGRRTIEYLGGTRGVILLALDYPYGGKTSRMSAWEFVRSVEPIRRAVVRTVPAAMLAVDYLLTRDDVDVDRIVLVGGSVGALFTPAVAATDTRIAAAAMLFGAADLQALMRANVGLPGVIAGPVSWLGAVLTSPVEPLKYIGGISPRPVYMLNGTGDPRMPERCSRQLHDAAGEPKTVHWIDAGHVSIRQTEFHRQVSRDLADWMVSNGLVEPGSLVETNFPGGAENEQ